MNAFLHLASILWLIWFLFASAVDSEALPGWTCIPTVLAAAFLLSRFF